MEQTGKIIIFDSEETAKIWFKTINEVKKASKVEALYMDFNEWVNKQGDSA
ncbi:MAG: hypothetical protein N3I35_06665 [Clostridia bacterium]|nr:hypothetical protein [Clostridia bacterium]